ncbi:MAG: hypothetical protein ACLPYS_04330 [Vulcanimicrobiaceae bacterium]
MEHTVELRPRIEAIARYLGNAFPSLSIHRYDDAARGVAGFSFIGEPYGAVEFRREFLETLPTEENALALEMHVRHVSGEIAATPAGQRLVFAVEGFSREAVPAN